MKLKFILLISTASILLLFGCQKESQKKYSESDELHAYWVNPHYEYPFVTFEKASGFSEDGYGVMFGNQFNFVERRNVGWCGTPPVTYGNFEGSWAQADSLLNISVAYWGGISTYEWKIISLTNSQLTIEIISQEYE